MSQADIELIKRGLTAFGEGNFDLMLETLDEDAEIQRLGGAGTLRGKEAIRAWAEPDAIEYQNATPTGFRRNGDRVLVNCDWRIRGSGSGIEVETKVFLVYRLRGGKVLHLDVFQDEKDALEAAGLRE
jgi:ketosteroid isomerase-like protein